MSDLDPLHLDFARADPEAFARVLAQADAAEATAVVDLLPAELAAAVVCRFPAARIGLLLGQDPARAVALLSAGRFEDAVTLLGYLPRDRRLALVNAIEPRARRRRLLQFLNYPAHSVGSLVSEPLVLLAEDAPITDVVAELRVLNRRLERPVVVLDSIGRYRGVLDLWQLATRDMLSGRVRDFVERVTPLLPETPMAEAAKAPQWETRGWLPVTDHEGHVLGWVSRERLLEGVERTDVALHLTRETLLDVASQLVRVMSELLARLLAPWSAR